jgi:hypothetical protein
LDFFANNTEETELDVIEEVCMIAGSECLIQFIELQGLGRYS